MDLRFHPQTLTRIRTALAVGVLGTAMSCGGDHEPASPSSSAVPQCNLDDAAALWSLYTEGGAAGRVALASASRNGGALLTCSYGGGAAYSAVHCYRNLEDHGEQSSFILSLDFRLPATSFNNQGSVSLVQALEFSMSAWRDGRRYEWALQWQNVGNDAPQWRLWNPARSWMPLQLPMSLRGDEWHALRLAGRLENGRVRYDEFDVDGRAEGVHATVDSAPSPGEPGRRSVAVQLDGNARAEPYAVEVDAVCLKGEP